MKKIIILKSLIVIGLFAISAIPEFGKELFVSETGKFGHPDLNFIILLVLGLYWDWKYIKQVIIVVCSLLLISTIIIFLSVSFSINKTGFLIYPPLLILTIFMTYRLIKVEKITFANII